MDYSLEPGRHRESETSQVTTCLTLCTLLCFSRSPCSPWPQSRVAQSTPKFPSRNPSAAVAHSGSLAWQVFPALDVAFAPGALCGVDQVARVEGLVHTVCRWPSVGGGVVRRKCCSAVQFTLFVYQHESGRR